MDAASEDEIRYRRLHQAARRFAGALAANPARLSASTAFIQLQVRQMLKTPQADSMEGSPASLAERALDWMTENHRHLSFEGKDRLLTRVLLMKEFGESFWEDLMVEWPLGEFAQRCADTLSAEGRLASEVCELGAGAGNLSRLIHKSCRLSRTDRAARFLDGRFGCEEWLYDFDKPYEGARQFDTVVAVNALHCAQDRVRAIQNTGALLKPEGQLVLAEGEPFVRRLEPSAINLLCLPFEGWIECGGFVAAAQWQADLAAAGFETVYVKPVMAGRYHLGNVIAARRA